MTKVLIVDDHSQNLYLLEITLKKQGYQVVPAANGAEALEAAKKDPPDIIISDVLMPVMDGYSLCRAWHADPVLVNIPFIFYTATYTDPADEKFALSLGAELFLVKPMEMSLFLAQIQNILSGNQIKSLKLRPESLDSPADFYQEYNQTLVRKLEDKLAQLETARDALNQTNAHLRLLREIDQAILSSQPVEKIAQLALKRFQEQVPFHRGSVTRNLEDGKNALVLAAQGYHATAFRPGQIIPLEQFGPQEVIQSSKVQWVSDTLPLVKKSPGMRALFEQGVRSGLRIPLKIGDKVFGSFNIGAVKADAFSPQERRQAEEVADLLAVALQNAIMLSSLRISEERFRNTFELAVVGRGIVALNGGFLQINRAFAEMLGYSIEEMLQKNWMTITHPDDLPKSTRLVEQLLTGKISNMVFEHRLLNKQGEEVWVNLSLSLMRDEQGQPLYLMGDILDVTEQVFAKQAVQSEIQRTRDLLDTTLDGYILADQNGQILDVNPAYCQMTGYRRETLLRMNINQIENKLTDQQVAERIEKMMTDGRDRFVTQHLRANGRALDLDVSITVLQVGGQPRVAAFVRDITQQLQIQQQLAESLQQEQHARQIAQTIQQANQALTSSLDLDMVMENMLLFLEKLVPYDCANVMLCQGEDGVAIQKTRNYEQWTDAKKTAKIRFSVSKTPTIGAVVKKCQSLLVENTHEFPGWEQYLGAEHVACWIGVPLVAGGEVLGLYSMDKTEPNFFTLEHLQLAESLAAQAAIAIQNAQLLADAQAKSAQLQKLSKRLAEAQEEERKRVTRELHDRVGQNLTALNLNLELIKNRLPESAQDLSQSMDDALNMVAQTVEHIRDVMAELRPPVLDDYGLMAALKWFAEDAMRHGELRVIVQGKPLSPRLPAPIEMAMFRVLQEAMINVRKHAQASQVTFLLEEQTGQIRLSIIDDGLGFDASAYQPENEQPTWGVVVMRERTQAIGGQLSIDSQPGKGTRVTLCVSRKEIVP